MSKNQGKSALKPAIARNAHKVKKSSNYLVESLQIKGRKLDATNVLYADRQA